MIKSTPNNKPCRPAAVLVGLDSMQGLQAARILSRRSVPVIGVASSIKSPYCRTRVCREILEAPTADEALIDHLLKLGNRLDTKAVLFPCEDTSVLIVSRHREKLVDNFHVLLPPKEVVEMLMDKVSFYSFAQEHDLPIPATWYIRQDDDLSRVCSEAKFPCILKPHDSAAKRWEDQTVYKAFKVETAEELRSTFRQFCRWSDCFIVQEWIEGDDSDLYSCNCYFNADGQSLVTFIARKLRQWPPETGISCLGEEIRNDEVLEQTLRLFGSVNYFGLGYMEMKRDRRNGQMYIVEPNIGRPTGRSAIAEAGGVELLYTAWCDAVGLPLPESRNQRYGSVKWIHLRKDLQSAFQYWRRGKLTIRDWLKSLRGPKTYALASWRDPGPVIGDFMQAVRSAISSRKRSKRALPQSVDTCGKEDVVCP